MAYASTSAPSKSHGISSVQDRGLWGLSGNVTYEVPSEVHSQRWSVVLDSLLSEESLEGSSREPVNRISLADMSKSGTVLYVRSSGVIRGVTELRKQLNEQVACYGLVGGTDNMLG
jgi:hypothetical protein